ncbi:HNH endonuclease [Ketobacter sp.]
MDLDLQGKNLLELLVSKLKTVVPGRPETYIGYKECHDRLGLPQMREKWGESLKPQGLSSLADWTKANIKPGITGIIINLSTMEPGKGYFDLFGKNDGDYAWWADQIAKSKAYDWSPYISKVFDLVPSDLDVPDREDIVTSRIIRDSSLSSKIKFLHSYECQLCGIALDMPEGKKYAEGHHIKPLGKPHNGPDVIENMICLCPNHHAMLDYGAIKIDPNKIRTVDGHEISKDFISYHNEFIYQP